MGLSDSVSAAQDADRDCTTDDRRLGGVTEIADRERAAEPEDLGRFFLERPNARDVDGVTALHEPDAVLASASGDVVNGAVAIRRIYDTLLADPPQFAGDVRPALRRGHLALTSTRGSAGARQQRSRDGRATAPGCGSPSAERHRIAIDK
jgi:ketosteroid isomerase-like protein